MFKKVFVLAVVLFGFCVSAYADETLNFAWTPNNDSTTGYKIVMDGCDENNVVVDIPNASTDHASYTLTGDNLNNCHSFAIYAVSDENVPGTNEKMRSICSNTAIWCPSKTIEFPRQFIISLTPVN